MGMTVNLSENALNKGYVIVPVLIAVAVAKVTIAEKSVIDMFQLNVRDHRRPHTSATYVQIRSCVTRPSIFIVPSMLMQLSQGEDLKADKGYD